MRTVLLVSPQFVPSPLAAVHRVRHLAKHLPAHGWRPVVIRVDEAFYAERPDRDLAKLVPDDVEQIRTPAIAGGLARLGAVGDLGLRGYPYLRAAIDEAVERYRPSVVFFTGFPFYQMLLAGRVSRRHGLPVVLDFQDPWVSAYGATRPSLSKEGLAHRLALMLEPRVLRHAAFITGVSETQNADMASRYPWLDARRMAAIPIGGDPEDFAAVGLGDGAPMEDVIELRYVGAFWPRAEPVVRGLMRGMALLREREPQMARRLRLTFTGTASASRPDVEPPQPVEAIARDEGVAEFVREHPDRAPFVEALRLMATAPGLILVGSDEPHYTASKIYPALMSGRPYLSLFHRLSSAHTVLGAAGGGVALGFDGADELTAL
ncbi:MAG: hypothetical protein JWO33_383, partial [Caulobacteraceae bacterium]|nr:hypothetical protein [Caulobacteraceae bacterium]